MAAGERTPPRSPLPAAHTPATADMALVSPILPSSSAQRTGMTLSMSPALPHAAPADITAPGQLLRGQRTPETGSPRTHPTGSTSPALAAGSLAHVGMPLLAAQQQTQSSLALSPPPLWLISPDQAGTPDSATRQRLIDRGRAAFLGWKGNRAGSPRSPIRTPKAAEVSAAEQIDESLQMLQHQWEEDHHMRAALEKRLAEAQASLHESGLQEAAAEARIRSLEDDVRRLKEEAEAADDLASRLTRRQAEIDDLQRDLTKARQESVAADLISQQLQDRERRLRVVEESHSELTRKLEQQQRAPAITADEAAALRRAADEAVAAVKRQQAEASRWQTLYQELHDAKLAADRCSAFHSSGPPSVEGGGAGAEPERYDASYEHRINELQLAVAQSEERCERLTAEVHVAEEARLDAERRMATAAAAAASGGGSSGGGGEAERLRSELTQLRVAYGEMQAQLAAAPLGAGERDACALDSENQRLCERLREAEQRAEAAETQLASAADTDELRAECAEQRARAEAMAEDLRLCVDPPRQKIAMLEQQVVSLTSALALLQEAPDVDDRNRLAARVSQLESELRASSADSLREELQEARRREGEFRLASESWERERVRRDSYQKRLEEDEQTMRQRISDLEDELDRLRGPEAAPADAARQPQRPAEGFYTEVRQEVDAEGNFSSTEVQRPIPTPRPGGAWSTAVTLPRPADPSDTTQLEKTLPLSLIVFNAIFSFGGLLPATRHDAGRLRPLRLILGPSRV